MVRLFLLALAVFLLGTPARAEVRLSVSYSEPADLFSLMDNTSQWLEGFTWPQYREEWVARFGWSDEDQSWVDRYREYRLRTFVDDSQGVDPATSPDGLFAARGANTAAGDPLATHFLSATTTEAALASLRSIASPADARMLASFYRHFAPKWRLVLANPTALITRAEQLDRQLNAADVDAFVARVADFFGVTLDETFRVFFTRQPPSASSSAEVVAGEYILLHSQPEEPAGSMAWDEIVMHELVHYISAHQATEQKRALSTRFLNRCPLPVADRRLWLVEEPLAVAWGQAAYSQYVRGKPLDSAENWYGTPWIDVVARTLAASTVRALNDDSTINDGIVDEAADRCRDLVAIAERLNTPPAAP